MTDLPSGAAAAGDETLSPIPSTDRGPLEGRWLLPLLLLLALIAGLWLAHHRWINPDEGAHLMDGVFVSDGLIPTVDYEARQVAYVYVIGGFVKLVGHDFARLRLFPLLAWLGAAVLVYLSGVRLFGRRVGLLAAALLLLTPFAMFMAPLVKTEPLTALLCTLGIYCLIRGVQSPPGAWWYAGAGAAFATGFYVRQSALAAAAAGGIFLLVAHRHRLGRLATALALMALGYAAVCAAVIGYFATHAPMQQVLAGPLNPLAFVTERIERLRGGGSDAAVPSVAPGIQGSRDQPDAMIRFERPFQTWAVRLRYMAEAGRMVAPLLMGGVLAVAWLAGLLARRKGGGASATLGLVLYGSWAIILAAAYLHWAMSTGVFFPAYAMEFLPALSILTAAVLVEAAQRLPERAPSRIWAGSAALLVPLVLLPWAMQRPVSRSQAAALTVLVLGAAVFGLRPDHRRRNWIEAAIGTAALMIGAALVTRVLPPALDPIVGLILLGLVLLLVLRTAGVRLSGGGTALGFISTAAIVAAAMFGLAASTRKLSLRYDSVWSPGMVREGAAYLKAHSARSDEILSGAVIWELQADRRPFHRTSHPLAFMDGMPVTRARELREAFAKQPPRFVVLDGYVERTYFLNMPELEGRIQRDYDLRKTLTDPRQPVRIYERRESSR
jgi:4-amino-4-deoxy-L-arabinose transferase-like glycosyltransferase